MAVLQIEVEVVRQLPDEDVDYIARWMCEAFQRDYFSYSIIGVKYEAAPELWLSLFKGRLRRGMKCGYLITTKDRNACRTIFEPGCENRIFDLDWRSGDPSSPAAAAAAAAASAPAESAPEVEAQAKVQAGGSKAAPAETSEYQIVAGLKATKVRCKECTPWPDVPCFPNKFGNPGPACGTCTARQVPAGKCGKGPQWLADEKPVDRNAHALEWLAASKAAKAKYQNENPASHSSKQAGAEVDEPARTRGSRSATVLPPLHLDTTGGLVGLYGRMRSAPSLSKIEVICLRALRLRPDEVLRRVDGRLHSDAAISMALDYAKRIEKAGEEMEQELRKLLEKQREEEEEMASRDRKGKGRATSVAREVKRQSKEPSEEVEDEEGEVSDGEVEDE